VRCAKYNFPVAGTNDAGYLAGASAVVLGGTGGLGAVCTRHMLQHGATVLATGRSERPELASQLGGQHSDRLRTARFDYPSDSIGDVAPLAREHLGDPLDILIHCIGPALAKAIDDTDAEELANLLQANVTSFHDAMLTFAPALRDSRGRVVAFTVAGADALVSRNMLPAYFAVKSALLSLTKSWATRLAPRGVTVNAIAPGIFPGEMELDVESRVPAGRPGEAEDIEQALKLLLAPESGYITGNNILVSGGYAL